MLASILQVQDLRVYDVGSMGEDNTIQSDGIIQVYSITSSGQVQLYFTGIRGTVMLLSGI